MKKALIAIAAASALTAAGAASAHCSYHETEGNKGKGISKMTQSSHQAQFIRVGSYQKNAAQPDIVDTAIAAGSFNTLVQAVQAAGLSGCPQGRRPEPPAPGC